MLMLSRQDQFPSMAWATLIIRAHSIRFLKISQTALQMKKLHLRHLMTSPLRTSHL